MALIEFKDLPDKSTPMRSKNVNFNFKEVLNLVFPVGRGFIDFTDTDYSNYLGFTWERELVGLTPVGYNKNDSDFNKIGKTGGSKKLQKHTHGLNKGVVWDGTDDLGNVAWIGAGGNKCTGIFNSDNEDGITTAWMGHGDFNTDSAGEGDSGNLPPYKVVAYWKRVA